MKRKTQSNHTVKIPPHTKKMNYESVLGLELHALPVPWQVSSFVDRL